MLLSKVEIVAKLKKKILTLIAITVVLQDHHCFTTRTVIRHAMEVNYHYIAIVVKMVHFFVVQMANCALMEMYLEVEIILHLYVQLLRIFYFHMFS